MSAVTVPQTKDVRDLLETLLGRDVEVRTGAAMVDPVLHGGAAIGIFTEQGSRLSAIVAMDVAAAAHIGACIGLVPPAGAREAAEEQVLPPALMDNAAEVLNIMRALFNTDTAPHHQLYATYAPGERPPEDVVTWTMAYVPRLDLDVEVQGYGAGRLSVVIVPG